MYRRTDHKEHQKKEVNYASCMSLDFPKGVVASAHCTTVQQDRRKVLKSGGESSNVAWALSDPLRLK